LVLVVEDEGLIRIDAADAIERAGFRVLEASTADQGLTMLENRRDIGLVYTDVHLPGSMNGLKLAWLVSQRWPSIKLLLTSGYMIQPMDLPAGARFCPKPCADWEIVDAINTLLNGPADDWRSTGRGDPLDAC